jgi:ribonuclease P protein component
VTSSSKEGLPKVARVRKRREYQELQKGRRLVSAHFVFFVQKRASEAERSRLGLIVSRKVGNAVARNLVKRRSRELFRKNHEALLGPGWDCVALARPGAAEVTFEAMHAEWRRALAKLRAR